VLRRYIQHQQMLESVRRRVTSALTYPAVLLGLALALGTLLFVYVIPRFATFYMGFAGDLPLITRLVIETATATRRLARCCSPVWSSAAGSCNAGCAARWGASGRTRPS